MGRPANPAIYQINTRVILQERGMALGRPATLDDLEDRTVDDIAANGFDAVWFLGVWQTGRAGQAIARSTPAIVDECRRILPDFREEDLTGSPFAITSYEVHPDFGEPPGTKKLTTMKMQLMKKHQ